MNYKKTSFLTGFFIWLSATVIFRISGQYFFLAGSPVVMTILYFSIIVSLPFVAVWVFKRYKLSIQERIVSSVYMVIPGMFLDVFCIQFFSWVFPNLPAEANGSFGAWLMWAYAIILLTGILSKGKS